MSDRSRSLAAASSKCVKRMTGTVIPRIHHDELAVEAVLLSEVLPALGVVPHRVVVGPGREES